MRKEVDVVVTCSAREVCFIVCVFYMLLTPRFKRVHVHVCLYASWSDWR